MMPMMMPFEMKPMMKPGMGMKMSMMMNQVRDVTGVTAQLTDGTTCISDEQHDGDEEADD